MHYQPTGYANCYMILIEQTTRTLTHLHSVLRVPVNDTGSIRLLHRSFRDFLLDLERYTDPQFQLKEKVQRQLFRCCLRAMSDLPLQRDIDYQAPYPGW